MKLEFCKYNLKTTHPFGTAHGVRSITPAVLLRVHYMGKIGYGEAAMPPYYPETQDSVISFIEKLELNRFDNNTEIAVLLKHIHARSDNFAAKNAIDTALHDALAKSKNVSILEMLTTDISHYCKYSSYTIGLDSIENMLAKCKEAKDYPSLKIKLDGQSDIKVISDIRKITNQELMVDANQSWKSVTDAINKTKKLHDLGVTIIEQPFPTGKWDLVKSLKSSSPIPIFADEDVQCIEDVKRAAGNYDGINIKLMKCGGISQALKMINLARSLNLKIMIGCMTESSCGISAASQLVELCDYVDLDGNLLLSNDPYQSTAAENGCILVDPNSHGIGLIDRSDLWI